MVFLIIHTNHSLPLCLLRLLDAAGFYHFGVNLSITPGANILAKISDLNFLSFLHRPSLSSSLIAPLKQQSTQPIHFTAPTNWPGTIYLWALYSFGHHRGCIWALYSIMPYCGCISLRFSFLSQPPNHNPRSNNRSNEC